MIVFPNCKINLGLHICNKRPDGYHNLETIFYPVPWLDVVEVIKKDILSGEEVSPSTPKIKLPGIDFSQTGIQLPGSPQENIIIKAYLLLKKDFPDLPSLQIHLRKNIPTGGGLGGGSADGAFTLQLLNHQFQLQLSTPQLLAYALQLGSDCPFFIKNKPCYATGRGEILEEIEVNLSSYQMVIINPAIHVSTADAFSTINLTGTNNSLIEIIKKPVSVWKDKLVNDFEQPVFNLHPYLKKIKETLYQHNALYAAMSGSGSTIYGIFEKAEPDYLKWESLFNGSRIKII